MCPYLEIGLLQMYLVKMRSYWCRVGPCSKRTGILIERGPLDTDTHKECGDEYRERGNASVSQTTPEIASKPPKGRGVAWNRFSLIALRRIQPC